MATEIENPIEREPLPTKTQTLDTLPPALNPPSSLPIRTEEEEPSPVKESKESESTTTTTTAAIPTTTATATTTDSTPVSSAASNEAPNSLQKKMRRAERFGVRVQLSEEEKRNSRAERFGMGVSSNGYDALKNSNGSDALKRSEELKRKARAERFGLPVQSVVDEEAKKKARLARFASVPKTDIENDKRKARAIRFSQILAAPAQMNGGANSQKETVRGSKAMAEPDIECSRQGFFFHLCSQY